MKVVANSLLCGLLVLTLSGAMAPGQEKKAEPKPPLLVIDVDEPFAFIFSMAVSPDGKRIATGHYDGYGSYGHLRLWDATTGEKLHDIKAHYDTSCWAVAFSPDGKRIASGGKEDVKIWDAQTGKELSTIKDTGSVQCVAYSPDGNRIVIGRSQRHTPKTQGAGQGALCVWDAETGKAVFDLDADTKRFVGRPFLYIRALAVSPDGKRIARAGTDNNVRIWDAETGKELLKYRADDLISLAFSPDSKRLVGASCKDGRRDSAETSVVTVWEANTGKELHAIKTPKGEVLNCAAFSPDGKWIVAGGSVSGEKPPGVARVWDAESGREVASFKPKKTSGPYAPPVVQVAFTLNGNRIVVATVNHSVQVFAFDKPAARP